MVCGRASICVMRGFGEDKKRDFSYDHSDENERWFARVFAIISAIISPHKRKAVRLKGE